MNTQRIAWILVTLSTGLTNLEATFSQWTPPSTQLGSAAVYNEIESMGPPTLEYILSDVSVSVTGQVEVTE